MIGVCIVEAPAYQRIFAMCLLIGQKTTISDRSATVKSITVFLVALSSGLP